MMAGFWASRNHSKLCLRTCVAILLLLVFFHIAQKHGNQEEIYKRDLLASTEIPAEYIDPTSIDLTPLVNTLIHSTQLGSSQLFSLLSVTSHSSLALHKLTLLVYNISNFRSIADNMFPRRYCYCVTNETNDLTDFTAILLDVMGNSTSYLQELFKSSSILSVSQNNISDCIYICVMAGKSDKYLSQLWEVDSIMPLFNQTITESAHKGNHSVNFDPSLTSRVHSTAHVSSTASEMTSTAPPTTTSRTRTTSFLTSTRAQPTTTTPSPTTKTRTRTTGRPTSISVPTTTSRTTVLMTPTTALPITITAQPTITIAPPSTTTAQQSRSTALLTTTQSTTDRPTTSTALPTTAQPTTALPIPALLPTTTVLPTTTTAQPTTTTALRIMTTATPTAAQPIPTSVQPTKVPSSTTTDQLTTTAQPTTTTPQLTTVQVTTTTTQLTTTTDQPTTALLWPTTPTIRFRMTTTPSTITAILITATKAQPTTDPPATGQAITTTQQLPTAQQTTTTTQLTTTTAPWTITNVTTTATRVITKAPITEKPGCPWRRPGLTKIEERSDNSITSSTTTTVSAHKLQPCVLELCKFFSQCLCHAYSYKTHMKRYCADSHLWYEKHTFEVCRRVRRVSFSRNLKQRCLARMCNKLWPEWKRDRESGIY
uniref:uncharacterized protein LOC124035964 isoform X1 n=2 Tax=Oncorhynchus gorbuscha TaxID=8017 RepID=UPI001EAF0F3B|nr:uncharacterized protein LOC124035964 isoform X1 [Oncorhynchus gorbuscha]